MCYYICMSKKGSNKGIYLFWGGIAIVLAIVIVSMIGGNVSEDITPEVQETVTVVDGKEPEYKLSVRERFGTENRKKSNVILQATQESWVKVEDARAKTVFSRVLVTGDVYYVPVGDKYKATFGNAGGVDIWVNGKLAPRAGDMGARKAGIVLTPESLMGKK